MPRLVDVPGDRIGAVRIAEREAELARVGRDPQARPARGEASVQAPADLGARQVDRGAELMLAVPRRCAPPRRLRLDASASPIRAASAAWICCCISYERYADCTRTSTPLARPAACIASSAMAVARVSWSPPRPGDPASAGSATRSSGTYEAPSGACLLTTRNSARSSASRGGGMAAAGSVGQDSGTDGELGGTGALAAPRSAPGADEAAGDTPHAAAPTRSTATVQ